MPKICEFETCRKYANYGEFYGKPIRCKEHKGNYKLISQLCQEAICNISSAFNYYNEEKSKYCVSHKLDGMITPTKKKNETKCIKNKLLNFI
jgi:formyltetrahydrofolate hydrolase